jgi:hypothetical protein
MIRLASPLPLLPRLRRASLLWALALAPCWASAQAQAPQSDSGPGNATDGGLPTSTPEEQLYKEALESLADGRKTDASEQMLRLIGMVPQHAGAWLDLALIQCSLGQSDEAERLFASVETRFNPGREILELIAEARDTGCMSWTPSSTTAFTLARGVDDNVNQGASSSSLIVEGPDGTVELPLLEDFLPRRDQYTQLGVDYVRDVTANGTLGFLQFYGRHYDRLHDYDTAALYAGIESPWRFKRWVVRTTGSVGASGLGGHLYQRQAQAQVRVTPPLPVPPRTQLHLIGAATRTDYAGLDAFNSRMLEARVLVSHHAGSFSTNLSAGLLTDRALNDRPGGNRHGNYLSLNLRHPIQWGITGELAYTRQTWNSASPYSPALLIDEVRAQRTQVMRASLSYQIGKQQSVVLEARAVRNRENISIFQYNNRQLQLSWQWHAP